MWQKRTIGIVMFVLLLAVATMTALFANTMRSTMRHLSLTEWVQQISFAPVLLLPEPENAPPAIGPLYSERFNFVEMAYVNAGTPNQPGATHTIWQSDSFTPFFKNDGLLKYYDIARDDVTHTERTVTLADQPVTVEIRRNTQFPNSGVTLFQLGGTSVVHSWQDIPEEEALRVLEAGVRVITPDDQVIIDEFDKRFDQDTN